jgi:quinol-cytochrome oxidoreductase complex cytochrome b subunit
MVVGRFSVDNATLNRFFSLHYLMPFAIVGLTIVHLSLLHKEGSNNPLGINTNIDTILSILLRKRFVIFYFYWFYLFFFFTQMPGTF